MSRRARVYLVTALAAIATAAVTVGGTSLYDDPATATRARDGAPPFLLEATVERDAERRDLERAASLLDERKPEAAAEIFARYDSAEARVGAALARWPRASTRRLEALVRERPRDAFVRLHLGLARYWEGEDRKAAAAWEQAAKVDPDSQSAVRASDLLHPDFARGLPTFTPSFPITRGDAERVDQRGLIAKGVLFQRLGRPISARRAFERAARLVGPARLDAEVGAAVARFDKANPSAAFSRLGPLSAAHPKSALVRFHLGLLLLWSGRLEPARAQLRKAVAAEPASRPAGEARRFLARLEAVE